MGMYTELVLSASLRTDDKDFLSDLTAIVEDVDTENYEPKTKHPLFEVSDRWRYMLRCDSYYFAGTTHSEIDRSLWELYKDEESGKLAEDKNVMLTIRCNCKNYSMEIEYFLDWIKPHICSDTCVYLGYMRYEEDVHPTLIYKENERIVYRTVSIRQDVVYDELVHHWRDRCDVLYEHRE